MGTSKKLDHSINERALELARLIEPLIADAEAAKGPMLAYLLKMALAEALDLASGDRVGRKR